MKSGVDPEQNIPVLRVSETGCLQGTLVRFCGFVKNLCSYFFNLENKSWPRYFRFEEKCRPPYFNLLKKVRRSAVKEGVVGLLKHQALREKSHKHLISSVIFSFFPFFYFFRNMIRLSEFSKMGKNILRGIVQKFLAPYGVSYDGTDPAITC